MYGFKKSLETDLAHLVGCELEAIRIAQSVLFLELEPANRIAIEGNWRLLKRDGSAVDEKGAADFKEIYKIFGLLGQRIEAVSVQSEALLHINFTDDYVFEIQDNPQYESCNFTPDIYI